MDDLVKAVLEVGGSLAQPEPLAHNFWKRHPRFHKFMFFVSMIAALAFTIFLVWFATNVAPMN